MTVTFIGICWTVTDGYFSSWTLRKAVNYPTARTVLAERISKGSVYWFDASLRIKGDPPAFRTYLRFPQRFSMP